MQVILRGVLTGGRDLSAFNNYIPSVSFEGAGLPFQPFWATFNNTVAGADADWQPGTSVLAPPWRDPSEWNTPYANGWTLHTALGADGLPIPVFEADPLFNWDTYVWSGYVYEGYIATETSAIVYVNSLNNIEWLSSGMPTITPNTDLGGSDYIFTIKPEYEDVIRACGSILYTQSAESAGYSPSQSSIGFIDIVDGASLRAVDLSTATYLSAASDAQTYALKGGPRSYYTPDTTIQIWRGAIVAADTTPDIFWTKRVLCEETQ